MPRSITICLVVLILSPLSRGTVLQAEDAPIFLSGYLKTTVVTQKPSLNSVPLEDDKIYTMLQSQLRIRLFYEPSDLFSWEAAYAVSPTVAPPFLMDSQDFLTPRENNYRIYDTSDTLWNSRPRDLSFFQNLDRCNINVSFASADLHIGRQAISFGSGKFINPTDVFSPFLFQDLNKENKTGVDALRLTLPTGDLSEIDLGLVLGKEGKMDNSAVFLRTRFSLFNTDLSLMAMDFKNNLMLAFDMTRAISAAGFWLEAAQVFANEFDTAIRGEDFFRLVSGIDYNFSDNTYLFVEYHYNSPGTDTKRNYLTHTARFINPFTGATALKTAYDDGGVYLMGRHYLIPGVSHEFTPLFSGTMQSLINLTDLSSYLSVSVAYNLKQDVFLEAGGYLALGERADMEGGVRVPQSEFGLYANMIYAGLRLYF